MISSSRVNPVETPVTTAAVRARAMPCSARTFCDSFSRLKRSVPSLCSSVMPAGISKDMLPFGPLAEIVCPEVVIVTPLGTAMGAFPMRDIVNLFLPNAAHELAAHAGLAGGAVGHHAVAGGDDEDAQAVSALGDLVAPRVATLAGTADALEALDRGLPRVPAQLDVDGALRALGLPADLVDEA